MEPKTLFREVHTPELEGLSSAEFVNVHHAVDEDIAMAMLFTAEELSGQNWSKKSSRLMNPPPTRMIKRPSSLFMKTLRRQYEYTPSDSRRNKRRALRLGCELNSYDSCRSMLSRGTG